MRTINRWVYGRKRRTAISIRDKYCGVFVLHSYERQKNEQNKAEQYKSNVFASKKKVQDIREEHTELIEYKENILKRIFNKIRQFFHV